jgi:hypothetical protein
VQGKKKSAQLLRFVGYGLLDEGWVVSGLAVEANGNAEGIQTATHSPKKTAGELQ